MGKSATHPIFVLTVNTLTALAHLGLPLQVIVIPVGKPSSYCDSSSCQQQSYCQVCWQHIVG